MSEKKEPENFVKIAVLESMIESQVIDSVLNEENIPHRIRSYHDTAYDGLFQLQKGWGEISAPISYKKEIQDILEKIRTKPIAMIEEK